MSARPTRETHARAVARVSGSDLLASAWNLRDGGEYAIRSWIQPAPHTTVYKLFVLNVVLQMFDGIATYGAIQLGWQEGNPLLLNSFAYWGVGPTLALFKALACSVLLLLYRRAQERLAVPAFCILAGVYCGCSLIPWFAILVATPLL